VNAEFQGTICVRRRPDATAFALPHPPGRLATPRIDRYRRSYEGTENPREAMQASLDWAFGLVERLGARWHPSVPVDLKYSFFDSCLRFMHKR
jgi:hypothetical protein